MNRLRSCRRAFTVLELLVVIAIISILAILILPAISRALDHAKRTHCASNLRQVGIAVKMYLNDHDQKFPPVLNTQWDQFGRIAETYYFPYCNGEASIFQCPATRKDEFADGVGSAMFSASFQFPSNTEYWTTFEFNGLQATDNTNRLRTASNKHVSDISSAAYMWDYTYHRPELIRHKGGLNVLYLDWHVGFLPEENWKQPDGSWFYDKGYR